jgi:exodeoxyribonuclease-5
VLSEEQGEVVERIAAWFERGGQELRVGGLAGTGKTTIARQLPAALGLDDDEVAYCAFTGKAASVLNRQLRGTEATTIHRLIYRPYPVHCQRCPSRSGGRCHANCSECRVHWARVDVMDEALRLIVVDEASMVSEPIYQDLVGYGVPVVWIGDHGQLPPVGGAFNLMADPDIRLETIHRQVADSPILKLAMEARLTGSVAFGDYGPDVRKRAAEAWFDFELDVNPRPLLLCGRNRTRTKLNRAIRAELGYPERQPVAGDQVICLRNNRDAGIYNGMTGEIATITTRPDGYLVEIALESGDGYSGTIAKEQFGRERTLSHLPRTLDLFDFGYCLTVHKAQGSEAERVILLEELLDEATHNRWLYTGITRAQHALEIVAPDDGSGRD